MTTVINKKKNLKKSQLQGFSKASFSIYVKNLRATLYDYEKYIGIYRND